MAQKTRAELRQEIAENLGIVDSNGNDAFDASTTPSLNRVNKYIDDVCREVVSDYPYSTLVKDCWQPFQHVINDVPSVTLYNTSGATYDISPYPNADALKTLCYPIDESTLVGISGTFSVGPQVSSSGVATTAPWSGVGYMYELPVSVDQIVSITLPQNGVKLNYVPTYDALRALPQGVWSSSGTTPMWYMEHMGISSSGNKVVEFFPSPAASLSGTNFLVTYKKKHVDMSDDTDAQSIVPDNFQDLIVHGTLEKCYSLNNDLSKSQYHAQQKQIRLMNFRKWSENQQDSVNRYRDGHYLGSNAPTSVGVDLSVGFMINGF